MTAESPQKGIVTGGQSEKLLRIQPHVSEYQALMNRATYQMAIMGGIWPLAILILTLVVQTCKPQTESVRQALQALHSDPTGRAWFVWGISALLQVTFVSVAQLMSEQYNIVLYLERDLRELVQGVTNDHAFWHYEYFLFKRRTSKEPKAHSPRWMEVGALCIAGLLYIIDVRFLWPLWPLTRWDVLGLILNAWLSGTLVLINRQIARTRHEWETYLWRIAHQPSARIP
jgi:hypothetical protein